MINSVLLAFVIMGLAKFGAGTAAALWDPAFLAAVNYGGIPRYLPHGVAFALAVASLLTWGDRIYLRALSAWWAFAAGAFARPALVHYDLYEPRIEVLMVPLAGVMMGLAIQPSAPWRTRGALLVALVTPVAVIVALSIPTMTYASQTAGVAMYTCILLAASTSPRSAAHSRRTS